MNSINKLLHILVIISLSINQVYAQLGIGGTQSDICSSSCNIASECDAQCLDQPSGNPYISCLCQESCVDIMGICSSCCNGTASNYAAFQDPFCDSEVDKNLQTCNFYGNVAPNSKASLFNSVSFASTASFPSEEASWLSQLPSPSLVSLSITNAQVTESTTVSAPYTTWGGPPKFSSLSSLTRTPTVTTTASSTSTSLAAPSSFTTSLYIPNLQPLLFLLIGVILASNAT